MGENSEGLKKFTNLEGRELDFIRKNVTLERLERVGKAVKTFSESLSDLEKYFRRDLMESVYRAHKGSLKVGSSKDRAEVFLALVLYILFGEPEVNLTNIDFNKLERRIRAVLKKRFPKPSYFSKYALRYLATKTGDRVGKTQWIDIGPYTYTILGGEIFYYCTLRALVEICRKALIRKHFNFRGIITWEQGIAMYTISEALGEGNWGQCGTN
jgi:hypothetical protein